MALSWKEKHAVAMDVITKVNHTQIMEEIFLCRYIQAFDIPCCAIRSAVYI